MSTLTNTEIRNTYDSLLKLADNGNLTTVLKEITDGLGNVTPLSISQIAIKSSVNVEASGFKTPTGLSSQFLKADGSLDSSDYALTSEIPTGNEIIDWSLTNALNIHPDNYTDTVYTHPANHLPSIITQDANNRFITDTQLSNIVANTNKLAPFTVAVDKVTIDRDLHVNGNITASEDVIAYVSGAVSGSVLSLLTASAPLYKSSDTNVALRINTTQFEVNVGNELQIKAGVLAPAAHTHLWADITDKPTTFAPAIHTHDYLPLAGGTMSGELLGYVSTSNTDGQNNLPFRLSQDYNSYMVATANNTWGLFWAGGLGAKYGTNGMGGPGDIWGNSANPNEFVFVGSDSTKWALHGNSGNTWQLGTISASNFTGTSSGTNTGDQDLSGYSTTSHNHDGRYLKLNSRLSANADTITQSGIHIWDVSEANDDPSGAADGLLTTKFWDSANWAVQQYHDFHSNSLYLKSKQNGVWQASWEKVWTDTNLTNVSQLTNDAGYLLNTTDTFTGTHTGDTLHLGGSQITASAAVLQVNGFQRTGNIYLHSGGNTPDNVRTSDFLSNVGGVLNWTGGATFASSVSATEVNVNATEPNLIIRDSRTGGTWSAGTPLGKIDFFTSDNTGIGNHSIASISVQAGGSNTASPDGELVFSTAGYNVLPQEALRLNSDRSATFASSVSATHIGIGVTPSTTYPLSLKANSGANAFRIIGRSDNLGYLEFFNADGTTLNSSINGSTNGLQFTGAATFASSVTANNALIVNGVDSGNPTANTNQLRVSGYGIMGNRGGLYFTNSSATGNISLGIGGNHASNTKLYINSDGNVGIGTTSPGAKLTIGDPGGNTTRSFQIEGNTSTPGINATIGVFSNATYISNNYYYSGGQVKPVATHGQTAIVQAVSATPLSNYIAFNVSDHTDANSAPDTRMTIRSDGNVGIGTNSPGQKLEVNGNAQISNSLLGTGIRSGNRGEFFLNAAGVNDVSEMFFGYGKGFTEANIRWGISDRGVASGSLNFYKGPANGASFELVMAFNSSNEVLIPNGNVGIGTTNPVGKLHVVSDDTTPSAIKTLVLGGGTSVNGNGQYIQFSSSSNDTLGSQIAGTRVGTGASSDLRFSTTSSTSVVSEHMRIDSTGYVGIGTISPSAKLHVVGSIIANSEITAYSDKRLKEVIGETPDVLDKLMQVNIVDYTRNDEDTERVRTGVIAQELREVFPQYVKGDEDKEMLSVNYAEMVSVCIKAIQELKEDNKELREEIKQLKNK